MNKTRMPPRQRQHNQPIDHLLDRLIDIEKSEHRVEHTEDQRAEEGVNN